MPDQDPQVGCSKIAGLGEKLRLWGDAEEILLSLSFLVPFWARGAWTTSAHVPADTPVGMLWQALNLLKAGLFFSVLFENMSSG